MTTIICWRNESTGVTDVGNTPIEESPGHPFGTPILVRGVSWDEDGAGDTTVVIAYEPVKQVHDIADALPEHPGRVHGRSESTSLADMPGMQGFGESIQGTCGTCGKPTNELPCPHCGTGAT